MYLESKIQNSFLPPSPPYLFDIQMSLDPTDPAVAQHAGGVLGQAKAAAQRLPNGVEQGAMLQAISACFSRGGLAEGPS